MSLGVLDLKTQEAVAAAENATGGAAGQRTWRRSRRAAARRGCHPALPTRIQAIRVCRLFPRVVGEYAEPGGGDKGRQSGGDQKKGRGNNKRPKIIEELSKK